MERSQFHATSLFVIYQNIFDREILLLEQYIMEVADVFDLKSAELGKQFSPDIEDYQLNALEREYFRNALDFPKILNSSILIGMYSIFEKTLKSICDLATNVFCPMVIPKKRKGDSYIEYYVSLLLNTYQISSAHSPELLKKLDDYRIIRNAFVHLNGSIRKERLELRERIQAIVANSEERLLLNEHTHELIIKSNQWLIRFSQEIQAYLRPIFEELIISHTNLIRKQK